MRVFKTGAFCAYIGIYLTLFIANIFSRKKIAIILNNENSLSFCCMLFLDFIHLKFDFGKYVLIF